MQDWIKNQFDDFDSELIDRLQTFVESLEKDGKKVIAERLSKEIQQKLKDRTKSKKAFLDIDPWIQMKVPEGGFSPLSLMLTSTESEIARQLTMIEYQIFSKIKVNYIYAHQQLTLFVGFRIFKSVVEQPQIAISFT